ncbi:MAG TPA: Hpt domain-containing protein [Usitatibacter sp.]|nr:Hpt domain-containing protein [Usitatibacter sp.]
MSSSTWPLDPAALVDLCAGDARLERALLVHFIAASHADVRTLHAAAGSADWELATRAAHRLSGSSKLIGACALAEVCLHVESSARRREAVAVVRALDAVDAGLRDVELFIRDRLGP